MTVKQYLESHRGFKSTGAALAGHSVLYHYRDSAGRELTTETMPDGATKVTFDGETRVVPSPKSLIAELGLKESEKDDAVIRIFAQVLDKLLRKHRGDVRADVEDAMERHARQQM